MAKRETINITTEWCLPAWCLKANTRPVQWNHLKSKTQNHAWVLPLNLSSLTQWAMSPLWWTPHISLTRNPRLSISSQNTPDLDSLFCPQVVKKSFFFQRDHRGEMRGRERETESETNMKEEKNVDLLKLKFFNVFLLYLEMRLFRVAAGPCDLRVNMLRLIHRLSYTCRVFYSRNLTVMQSKDHIKPMMWQNSKNMYLKEEGLFEMRVAGFLLYLCFPLVRPGET